MNTVGVPGSLVLPSCRRGTGFSRVRYVAVSAVLKDHSVLVDSLRRLTVFEGKAAGGAVPIVAAEFIGGGTARDEGAGEPASWHGWVSREDFVGSGMSRQTGVNAGNTATTEYECRSMHEDKPTRNPRDGQYLGRVVGAASVSGFSVSSVDRAAARPTGGSALGVMGGFLQPVSSPVEPPVSSLSGLSADSSTTAPAPFADFRPGEVSPLTDAAAAVVEVVPGRLRGRSGSPSGQGRKSCLPVPAPARKP